MGTSSRVITTRLDKLFSPGFASRLPLSLATVVLVPPIALFPVVQLVFERALGLLSTMIYSIQHKIRMLTEAFCKGGTSKKAGKEISTAEMVPTPGWSCHVPI